MFLPLSDENPTLRRPVVTYLLLAANLGIWLVVQGAGEATALLTSVCNLGMVPGELTGRAPLGFGVPIGGGASCVVDNEAINLWTPLISMFLHGGWLHLLGNCLFLWIFGNNVEDSMGRVRFLVFYVLCGLAAAGAHVLVTPSSAIPTVGASGAISGVMGAYLVLYPRVRVKVLLFIVIFIRIIQVPAWVVLLGWFGMQLLMGVPQLLTVDPEVSGSGVAFWAHIGGFAAGVLLVKPFENRSLVSRRTSARQVVHPWPP
jgi:membrane associated rhomboid family serine protease